MSLITITSGIGCGENAIARIIQERLGFTIYDDRRLQEEAVAMGISSEELQSLNETAPGLLNRLVSTKPRIYLDIMEAVVYRVSGKDNAIILGHGAPFLLRDFGCALHVRVYASETGRIELLRTTQGISEETAKKLIQKSDRDRRHFMQYAFHMEWEDPSLYDLIVNRDKLGIEGCADIIMEARESEQAGVCSITMMDEIERRALQKQAETEILKNALNPGDIHVDVPEQGIVVITGIINPLEPEEKLVNAVKAVPGVRDVKVDLAYEKIHDI